MIRMGFYTAGEVARTFKVNKMTIFRWERARKIPSAKRHPMNNYRVYTADDIKRLRAIVEGGLK